MTRYIEKPAAFQIIEERLASALSTDGIEGANKIIDELEVEAAAAKEFAKIEDALECEQLTIHNWTMDAADIEAIVRDRDLAHTRLEFAKNALLIAQLKETLH